MMKPDCRWMNDVECPYASSYEKCDNCDKYEKDDRKHPLDDRDRGCQEYHIKKDMGEI